MKNNSYRALEEETNLVLRWEKQEIYEEQTARSGCQRPFLKSGSGLNLNLALSPSLLSVTHARVVFAG